MPSKTMNETQVGILNLKVVEGKRRQVQLQGGGKTLGVGWGMREATVHGQQRAELKLTSTHPKLPQNPRLWEWEKPHVTAPTLVEG